MEFKWLSSVIVQLNCARERQVVTVVKLGFWGQMCAGPYGSPIVSTTLDATQRLLVGYCAALLLCFLPSIGSITFWTAF